MFKVFVGADASVRPPKAVLFQKSTANPYAPAHLAVGADAYIGPYGICMSAYGFARNFRKINCISAGRTESPAPAGICNPG